MLVARESAASGLSNRPRNPAPWNTEVREPSFPVALWRGMLELVAPPLCASCREPFERATEATGAVPVLCPHCHAALEWLAHDGRCQLCQQEIAAGDHPPATRLCRICTIQPSHLEACLAAVSFEGQAARWIHRFKYPAAGLIGLDPAPLGVMRECARRVAARAPGPPPGCVVPIPLHPRRLRARGFNPAALLARQISRASHLPLDCDWLWRTRDTPSQTGLDRTRRRRNVAGAFACHHRRRRPHRRVWLVDDVVTTGATLGEAAQVLRREGVLAVVGLCAARTPGRHGAENR